MATKTINVIIHSTSHTPTAAGWNKILHTATGAIPLNFSDGSASPFTLNVSGANTTNLSNAAYAGGDRHGIPQDVIRGTGPYVGGTARAMTVSRAASDNTITNMALWGASAVDDATRQTRWTVAGGTYDHDDRNYGLAAPTSANTSGASYPITVNAAKVPAAAYGYPNVLIFTVNIPEAAQTITSVNGGAGVKIGSTGNTAVTNGFTSAPNAGTLGGEPLTVTAYNAGTKVVTFDGPVVVGGETFPEFSSAQTLVLTNGAESASLLSVPLAPPTGRTLITVASPENVDEKAFGHILVAEGVTPVNGDTFYGVDADVLWLPTTYGSATALPAVTPVVYRDTSTGLAYELLLTVNGEGVVTPSMAPRSRSLIRVSGSVLTIDGVTHPNNQPISVSPYGGLQSSINGVWLAQSVAAVAGALVVDGVTINAPNALYLSPAGKLTTTPNGQPVATVRS